MTDHKQRHATALLYPSTPEERTLSTLFRELSVIADRYKNDSVMLPAVEYLGSCILELLDGDVGAIDQSSMTKQVFDTVTRAGGDTSAL